MVVFKRSAINRDFYGYIFVSPFIIIFLIFIAYPIANTFWLSVTNSSMVGGLQGEFIGLNNFRTHFNNPMFFRSITNTWLIWISGFIPQMFFALLLAAMFTSTTFRIKGAGFFKAIYYLPNLLMPATIAALFASYLSIAGPFNQFLVGTGILEEGRNFLNFPLDSRITVVFLQWWMWFGQTAIVLAAGMTAVSPSYYESAMIDGANQIKMFFYITIPLLKPILLFVLVTSLAGGMQIFDIPFFLFNNGRGGLQGEVMTMNVYMNMVRTNSMGDVGLAAAVSVVLFFMSSIVAIGLFRLFRNKSEVPKKARKGGKAV